MRGDANHFSHRLIALGMSPREMLLTIYLLAFSIGLTAPLLYALPGYVSGFILAQATGLFCIIALLERAGARK
jgi:UDP-GlcNAc:undecaprenyl-phosphate GlcNAc-1-phosphate transferase